MRALPQAARWYLVGLWCSALLLALLTLPLYWHDRLELSHWLSALIFVVMLTIADLTAFHMENGRIVSIAVAVLIAALTALNWPMMLVVIAAGTLAAAIGGEMAWWQLLSIIAVRWLAFIAAAGIARLAWAIDGIQGLTPTMPYTTFAALVGLLATGALIYAIERAAEAGLEVFNEGRPLREVWRGRLDDLRWYTLMLAPLGGLLATLWNISGLAFFLGIVPIVVVQRAFRSQVELSQRSSEVQKLAAASSALNSKLERLQSLLTTLIATRDVPTMFATLCDGLAAMLGASNGWAVLLDDEQRPHMVAWHNLPVTPGGSGPHYVPWPQSYEPVLSRQRVVVFTDQRVHTLAPLTELADGEFWNALIVIPLVAEKHVLGAICLSFAELRGLNESEQRVLTAFARQSAMVLENARLFREVQESQARLIKASKMEALGSFAAGIAHEFNNLLAGMLGYAQLGLATDDGPTKNESLKVVVDTCKRGKSITGGLLTFARRKEPCHVLADLREAVEGTTTLMEIELRKCNISVERQIMPVPPTICDAGQISQVVLNLITNARDAMKPDGGKLTVELFSTEREIIIAVRDTGCGIPDAIREKIFEPFVTTKGALGGGQSPGTGLGLSVSYGIVREHGGAIEIESEVGKGTSMIVHLPIITDQPAPPPAAQVVDEQVPPLNILAVDDDPTIGGFLRNLLDRAGHQITVVESGVAAMNTYRSGRFDLVLSDLAMPGMNGVELVRALCALDPDAMVIVFTGQSNQGQIDQALKAGAVGYLRKPFELDEILAAIKSAWNQRRLEGVSR